MNVEIKSHYTPKEYADMQLTLLPHTPNNVRVWLNKHNVSSRKREGRGGGLEYAFGDLPKEVQAEIKALQVQALMPKPTKADKASRDLTIAEIDTNKMTNKQRSVSDNRLLMALLVQKYEAELNVTQEEACKWVEKLSHSQALPVMGGMDYNEVAENAKANKRGVGVSVRFLKGCISENKKATTPTERLQRLAPKQQGRPKIDWMNLPWMADFLAVYRDPNGRNFNVCYGMFRLNYAQKMGVTLADKQVPTIWQVRNAFNAMPVPVRERGRKTGLLLKQLLPFVERNWNADFFANNHVWVGDGHSLKLEVAHPISKAKIAPELTVIMDAPSRYIVGWSLSYTESGFAVLDALRHAMQNHGVPAIYYSDNGRGQTNEMLDNAVSGVLPRLGVTHATGIPGNAQGRGIIERFMQGVPKQIAQNFITYRGRHANPDVKRVRMQATDSYSNALMQGKLDSEMTDIQLKGRDMLPSWEDLQKAVADAINDYNQNHYHRTIRMTPAQKRLELDMTKNQGEYVWLEESDLRELPRPAFVRTVERGRVRYDNDFYFDVALTNWHGKEVVIYLDQHNLSSVTVRDMEGRYICEAQLNGNKRPAMPEDMVSKADKNRIEQAIKRKQNRIDQLKAQQGNDHVIDHAPLERLIDVTPKTTKKDGLALFLGDLDDLKVVNH